jgi:hypothetical protein
MFFNSIMEMQRLYAEGLVYTADAVAHDLFREAAMLCSPVTPGAREDLQRDIRQAGAFGTLANAAGVLRAPKDEIPDAVFRRNEVKHVEAE